MPQDLIDDKSALDYDVMQQAITWNNDNEVLWLHLTSLLPQRVKHLYTVPAWWSQ